jgi:hypothetical protein
MWRLMDECECGDYRHQHGKGRTGYHSGACYVCAPFDPMNGGPCNQFRFMTAARDEPEGAYKARRAV